MFRDAVHVLCLGGLVLPDSLQHVEALEHRLDPVETLLQRVEPLLDSRQPRVNVVAREGGARHQQNQESPHGCTSFARQHSRFAIAPRDS